MDRPVLLQKEHNTSEFDCGEESLNVFLKKYAAANQASGSSRSYVLVQKDKVLGYYTLAPASVEFAVAPDRVTKGQARQPVPCILLARLGIDQTMQGQGLGKHLFRDSLLRAYQAHEIAGGRAFLVHALNEAAKDFYLRLGMTPSPTNPLHIFYLFKDIRQILG